MAGPSDLLRYVAGLALPARCASCGAVTGSDHRFCVRCWGDLRFLGEPWCAACCRPFEHDQGDAARCAPCLARPPVHDGVRAAVAYGPVARSVVLKLKYGRRLAHADTLARQMARLVPQDADMLVPVPLHRWRLWSRGFNQAQLIAEGVARLRPLPVVRDVLARVRGGGTMKGIGRRERARLVGAAFAIRPGRAEVLVGRHVILVDDVHTSGATAGACTRALKQAGAARVTVLCWARVLGDDDGD